MRQYVMIRRRFDYAAFVVALYASFEKFIENLVAAYVYLETRRVDQAVEGILLSRDGDAVFPDALDAFALGVHQMNVRAVEGRQILIMKARPLAELVVPGLQGLRRLAVADD